MLTNDEQDMMLRIDRNRLRVRVFSSAARLLQFWFRHPQAYKPESSKTLTKRANPASSYSRDENGKLTKSGSRQRQRQPTIVEMMFVRQQLFTQLCRTIHELMQYDDANAQALPPRPAPPPARDSMRFRSESPDLRNSMNSRTRERISLKNMQLPPRRRTPGSNHNIPANDDDWEMDEIDFMLPRGKPSISSLKPAPLSPQQRVVSSQYSPNGQTCIISIRVDLPLLACT